MADDEWETVSVWAVTSKAGAKREAQMLRNQKKNMNYRYRVIKDPNSDSILVQRAFRKMKLYY